ncbi:C40 family peptidase [Corynebacterium bovis]|uniref:C40 family peptidase n=1 Tax=Corynebacterium bovis TaxID=36808 RepID=UPI003CC6E9CE
MPSAEELTRRVDAALPGAVASAAVPRLDDAALRVRRAVDAGAQLADLARQALAAVAGAGADIAGIVRAGVEEAAAGALRAAAGSPTVPALAAAALTAGLTGTSARVDARLAALDDTLADLLTRTDDAVAGLPGVPPPPGRPADPAAGTPAPTPADGPASHPGEVGVVPPPPEDSGPAPGGPTGPPPAAPAPAPPPDAPDAAPAPAPDDAGPGAAAVAAARSVLGTPYRWGGTSPDTGFDCSGLTSWAWAQAGVTLPRTADAQTVGRPVGREELRPGDLVVWDGHVALVSGPDTMIEAGDPVQENPVRTDNTGMTFLRFWRPTG